MFNLFHFLYADGVAFGVGTADELDALKREGVAPADAWAKRITDAEIAELLA